ncbi:MAG: hypothetical protein AAB837_02845 [Patescibacteria group bacterium]
MEYTIIYYSSNREKPEFEKKIQENILGNSNGLSIVSVTQRPMSFGKNICVGEHFNCYYNEFRQIQIALQNVETPYVLVTESDFLYPPDYFLFEPKELGKCYRYKDVWVLYDKGEVFVLKGKSDGAQLMDRKMWLDMIDKWLDNNKMWSAGGEPKRRTPQVSMNNEKYMWSGNPAITFKTKNNITPRTKTTDITSKGLPYWGTVEEIRKTYEN